LQHLCRHIMAQYVLEKQMGWLGTHLVLEWPRMV